MVLTTLFIIAFGWSVARGISKNMFLAQSVKKLNPPIEMKIPLKTEPVDKEDTIHYHIYLKERKKMQLKGRFQSISLTSLPGQTVVKFHLN